LQEQEFIAAIKKHQLMIRRLAMLYAADHEEHKDLFQDIIFHAWKGINSFRGDAKFSTWLYRVGLNTIFTVKRKQRRLDYREEDALPEMMADEDSDRRLQLQALYKAIRSLPETDRAIITLHLEGYNNQEIAEITGITANNTGVKIHRIKNELKAKLS
jgi:RNA polymerase sigma-70 factor (ECF subfamily)